MCISTHKLHLAVETLAVILLTISVLTIGASLYLFESIPLKLGSVLICLFNIIFNIFLLFGLKDKSTFFIFLWMISSLLNVLGGLIMLCLSSLYKISFTTNHLDDFIPLDVVKNVWLVLYVALYIWSWVQVFNLYQEFSSTNVNGALTYGNNKENATNVAV